LKTHLFELAVRSAMSRRRLLQGAAALGGVAALGLPKGAMAQDASLRAQILAIPGVGAGSPTDADWRAVGELCLGPTRANVAEGEFAGVELTFMGLNNQNLHNFLFRGFLAAWEEYTGATINWIDLAQADYNPRLQQAIATGYRGLRHPRDGRALRRATRPAAALDPMPDWVKEQIDMADLVAYLQPPSGTWDGQSYRISIDGDCHTFAYRPTTSARARSGWPRRPRPGRGQRDVEGLVAAARPTR
jgi:multiple sugar transport system substrate-binding protein